MTKQILYTYLGTNGTICSPVHLEGIYYVRKYQITASEGYLLTKGDNYFTKSIIIPEDEISSWYEISKEEAKGQM